MISISINTHSTYYFIGIVHGNENIMFTCAAVGIFAGNWIRFPDIGRTLKKKNVYYVDKYLINIEITNALILILVL